MEDSTFFSLIRIFVLCFLLDAPTVTLQGSPSEDIEEGKDRVALQCLSDANPPASTIWKQVGAEKDFSFKETIEFDPATRKNSGTYVCKASNHVGVSNPLSVHLSVKCKRYFTNNFLSYLNGIFRLHSRSPKSS